MPNLLRSLAWRFRAYRRRACIRRLTPCELCGTTIDVRTLRNGARACDDCCAAMSEVRADIEARKARRILLGEAGGAP